MPSLYHLLDVIETYCRDQSCEIPGKVWRGVADEIRRQYAAQRVYIPPIGSPKDPARTAALRKAVRKLPTGVAASTHGVSADWARKLAKRDNRDT
jgi:hypothetical protein